MALPPGRKPLEKDWFEKHDLEMQSKGWPPTGFYLDSDIVDSIALRSLRWHLAAILSDMEEFENHDKGHPDDYDRNISLKHHFEKVLDYYGN